MFKVAVLAYFASILVAAFTFRKLGGASLLWFTACAMLPPLLCASHTTTFLTREGFHYLAENTEAFQKRCFKILFQQDGTPEVLATCGFISGMNIIVDTTGQIARPPGSRSPAWNEAASKLSSFYLSNNYFDRLAEKIRDDYFWLDPYDF